MNARAWIPVGLLIALVLVAPCRAIGEEGSSAYRVLILGRWGREQQLGSFDTYEQAAKAGLDWSLGHPKNLSPWDIREIAKGNRTQADKGFDERNSLDTAERSVAQAEQIFAYRWYDLGERRRALAFKSYQRPLQHACQLLVELRRQAVFEHNTTLQAESGTIDSLIGRFNAVATRFNRLNSILDAGLPMIDGVPNLKNELPVVNIAASPEPPPLNLAGKTLVGTIGGADVMLLFDERTFHVIGDLKGSGVWQLNATGVGFETRNSVYRGVATGFYAADRIQGYRYFKDYRPSEEFHLKVHTKVDFTGRWRLVELRYPDRDDRQDNEGKLWHRVLTFDPARETTVTTENSAGDVAESLELPRGTFGREGDKLTFTPARVVDRGGLLQSAAQSVWRKIP